MTIKKIIGFYLFVFLISPNTFSIDEFPNNESLIKERKFQEATKSYEEYLKEDPTSSSAYFNLGNCYYYQKKFGYAVWAFEKALKYSPQDKDAAYNIGVTYLELKKSISWKPIISQGEAMVYEIGSNFWAYMAIFFSIMLSFLIFLILFSKNRNWKKIQIVLSSIVLIALVVSILFSYSSKEYFISTEYAIIVSKSIPIFKDQLSNKKIDFLLLEGDRVKILSENNARYLVELTNKEVYSIEKKGVEKI